MENLSDVVDFFNGTRKFIPVKVDLVEIFNSEANKYDVDFPDVRGRENVKCSPEPAAGGGHNILMLGFMNILITLLLFNTLEYLSID
jgi:magnesium chelatase family protein